jgi:hypothetical protein
MNIDLQDLKTTKPHHLKSFFSNYSKSKLAETLGISSGYLLNVLNGHYKPSDRLERDLQGLAKTIRAAELEEFENDCR